MHMVALVVTQSRCLLLAAVSVIVASHLLVGNGLAQEVSAYDRFRLFNECRPMRLIVETLDDDALAIDLTEDSIQAAVESRLRSARLYDSESTIGAYLYINVNVLGSGSTAYSLTLAYNKPLLDPVSLETFFADYLEYW